MALIGDVRVATIRPGDITSNSTSRPLTKPIFSLGMQSLMPTYRGPRMIVDSIVCCDTIGR